MLHVSMMICLSGAVAGAAPATETSEDASKLDARTIVDRAIDRNVFGFESAISKVTLVLKSKSGSERIRDVEIRSRKEGDLSRTVVRFESPADVAGTMFLVREKEVGNDDQFLYLPALGKVKRITGSQRHQRFMGTDLTYADLESRDMRDGDLERQTDETLGGAPAFVIGVRPKDGSDSQYNRLRVWVHRQTFVTLKIEFYDEKDRLLKVLRTKRLEKKDGRWVAMLTDVENVQKETGTVMRINGVDFRVELSADDFTQRALVSGR